MSEIFTSFDIVPSYAQGFRFSWELRSDFNDPGPWKFTLEECEAPGEEDSHWIDSSPELVNLFVYQETERRMVPKDPVLYFRVRLETPVATYYSFIRSPYGDLDRREFLMAREIMRNEVVQAKKLAGIEGQVYIKSLFGPICCKCRDPVTGTITNPDCDECYGVGRSPGYHGPYFAWLTFSPARRIKTMENDQTGTKQISDFQVRLIGVPLLKKDDVLVDTRADKRYYVDTVADVIALRRIPLVQNVLVHEAPVSEAIYELRGVCEV